MSAFSGKAGKGAMAKHRDERYKRAVLRQHAMVMRGYTGQRVPEGFRPAIPAPVEEFLRPGHTIRHIYGDQYMVVS